MNVPPSRSPILQALRAADDRIGVPAAGDVPFEAHIELLQFFLARRGDIVERIQLMLNAQRKPIEFLQDESVLSRHFEDCFFTIPGAARGASRLRGQLDEAHWRSGFRPREIPGLRNGLIDPAEMMIRAFHLWQQTRWPGRSGRVRYAHTLFNIYIIRCLELLSMRVWDAGTGASDRLSHVQQLLDRLWTTSPADQPAFVRDARWLIQLAQSPATDDLGAYFVVAAQIAEALPEDDRLAVHGAGARMAGGHLRSQIRYYSLKHSAPLDDGRLVLSTRNSNALDFALLIQDLVPLLRAYEAACRGDDRPQRLNLASAICQGLSPDPDLFLNHPALLGAYSMLEEIFITFDSEGHAVYTPAGQRHVRSCHEYASRIAGAAPALLEDCAQLKPVAGTYSPYGLLYGFSSDLLEHMALKASQPDAETRFSLEDVFIDTASDDAGGTAGHAAGHAAPIDKLAWVTGWRKLPHVTAEATRKLEYPQQFADDVFDRLARALHECAKDEGRREPRRPGRLFIQTEGHSASDLAAPPAPALPARYIRTSDPEIAGAGQGVFYDARQLLGDRREGKFIVSHQTPGGWSGISKDVLTEVVGTGQVATVSGLTQGAAEVLALMCPEFVVALR